MTAYAHWYHRCCTRIRSRVARQAICEANLPRGGTVFVFRSRRADRLKLLYWDGTGLVPLGDASIAFRAMDGLQASGRYDLHLACDQGRDDGIEPCPVRGALCRFGLASRQGVGNAPACCGRMNHPIDIACFYQMILVILMHAKCTDPRSFRHPCRATRGGSGIAGRGGSPQEYHQAARAPAYRGLKTNHFRPMDRRVEPRPAW
jgi:hypothetical protein